MVLNLETDKDDQRELEYREKDILRLGNSNIQNFWILNPNKLGVWQILQIGKLSRYDANEWNVNFTNLIIFFLTTKSDILVVTFKWWDYELYLIVFLSFYLLFKFSPMNMWQFYNEKKHKHLK